MRQLNQYNYNRKQDYGTVIVLSDSDDIGMRKIIVDESGHFAAFPGIAKQAWIHSLESDFDFESGAICYSVDFVKTEGGFRCSWTIQPDGRYYADADGYGMENDLEIVLSADMNQEGDFVHPFTCSRVGRTAWKTVERDRQIRNIEAMEIILDRANELIRLLPDSKEEYLAYVPEIRKLEEYYYSVERLIDLYDDEQGNLPKDLKRGVLSQDAIYDMLCDEREKTQGY